MPLPIGHALTGIAFFETRPGLFFKNKWADVLFFILLANLPDADFLPGLILGFPNLYHHGIFHSLGAALAAAIVMGWIFSNLKQINLVKKQDNLLSKLLILRSGVYQKKQHFWRFSAFVFLIFFSHLLLDFFTRDFAAPYGLPLFWPLSKNYYIAAQPIFINITRSALSANFFSSLFSPHNLKAALLEIMLLGGLVLLVGIARWLLNKCTSRSRHH
jgi:inner membrane protein